MGIPVYLLSLNAVKTHALTEYRIRQQTTFFFFFLNRQRYFKWQHQSFDVYCSTQLYQPVTAVGGMVQNDFK